MTDAPHRLAAPLVVLLLALLLPGAAAAEDGVSLEGTATVSSTTPLGQQDFDVSLLVSNPTDAPVTILGNLFLLDRGGWLEPLDPESLDGSYFRANREFAPSEEAERFGPWRYSTFVPAAAALLSWRVGDAHHLLPLPITESERTTPEAVVPDPVFGIGCIGPLQAVPFSDGKVSVLLIAQHQSLGGHEPEEVETRVSISSDVGAQEPLGWSGLSDDGDQSLLWPFVRRIDVAEDFAGGQLLLTSDATVGGEDVSFRRDWHVERVEPAVLTGPVLGAWQLGNGPGQVRLHGHYRKPQHRYAYDMVVMEEGRTYRGPVHDNASYFAWNRSIRAAADGVIVDICDREPDKPGKRASGSPCRDNRVVVEHADGLYTAYLHIQQHSATVSPGTRVKAGQVIAQVGNSGSSSEPHLHFMAFRLDASGKLLPVPVTFANAYPDARGERPIEGVPVGGRIYHFIDR